jgi:predicted  nucleic acid-binding Zn ribbon protein
MFVAEILVPARRGHVAETCDALQVLLGALRMNGQVLGREWPIAQTEEGLRTPVMIPERGALGRRHQNGWVREALEKLSSAAGAKPQVMVLGDDPTGAEADRCKKPSCYVLFTTYLDLNSPLCCGDCFRPVPLYRIPHTAEGEYYDVLCWQFDYKACDQLQMNCATGERFGTRELSRPDSSLSRQGRSICRKISELTGKPAYYYLYRYGGRGGQAEARRLCPGCGGEWLLKEPWHRLFDFRCDRCRLVSNIAWDVR